MGVIEVISTVAGYYGLPSDKLLTGRTRSRVAGRQIAMLLMRELTLLSTPEIAEVFELDESTVRHGIRRGFKRLCNDPVFARDHARIKEQLLGVIANAAH